MKIEKRRALRDDVVLSCGTTLLAALSSEKNIQIFNPPPTPHYKNCLWTWVLEIPSWEDGQAVGMSKCYWHKTPHCGGEHHMKVVKKNTGRHWKTSHYPILFPIFNHRTMLVPLSDQKLKDINIKRAVGLRIRSFQFNDTLKDSFNKDVW